VGTDTIALYNWGEPFLNPYVADILGILKRYGLKAAFSSNFIRRPRVSVDNLSVIKSIKFSVCGLSERNRKYIYGAGAVKALGNFTDLCEEWKKYQVPIVLSWQRYRFNEDEFWGAYKLAKRLKVYFNPYISYYNDLLDMLGYASGDFREDRLSSQMYDVSKRDILTEYLDLALRRAKKDSQTQCCSQWDYLAVDEYGQLLPCCGLTNRSPGHVLGKILDMSAKDMWTAKESFPLCGECVSHGLPYFADYLHAVEWPMFKPVGVYDRIWYLLHAPNGFVPQVKKSIRGLCTRLIGV